MPKLATTDKEKGNCLVRSYIRAGQELFELPNDKLAKGMNCCERTIRNRLANPDSLTLRELRLLTKLLKLNPVQCASILMGRSLSKKDFDGIML